MFKPLPSPRGTNHERLFIVRGRGPRPVEAFDSLPPTPEMKQQQRSELLDQALTFILSNCTPEERAQIAQLISGDAEAALSQLESHKATEDDDNTPLGAKVDAPGARNYPTANDAAFYAFLKRFPNANRLG